MNPCFLAFGHHFKAPMIGLVSSVLYDWMYDPFGNPASPALISNFKKGDSLMINFASRLISTFNSMREKLMFNHYSQKQNNYVTKHFGPNFPNIDELQKEVSLLLVNSHYSLTGAKPFTTSVVEVGGIHIQEDGGKLTEVNKYFVNLENGRIMYKLEI